MFVDIAQKTTLNDNDKEALVVEKILLALEKKVAVEERKPTKKVTFKEEPKKKNTKDPYDMEGLKNVLKQCQMKWST